MTCLYQLIMLTSIINFIKENKYKILGGFSFGMALYFAVKYMKGEGEAKISSLIEAIEKDKIHQVVLEDKTIFFRSKTSEWFKTFLGDYPSQQIFALIKDRNIQFSSRQPSIYRQILPMAGSCLLGAGIFKMAVKKLNSPDISPIDLKSSIYQNGTFFKDYYGGEQIKEKFTEIIDFLRNPEKYKDMGARIRRGVMFYGPPGTGKTMLARALANQSGCSFIKLVASEFQQMYVGVGAKRVRQLFQAARKCTSGCIIFVDQIDALGNRANHLRDSHETTTTINQFLNEMDGFDPNQKVVVVAATNRLDLVDSAILRSGRFDVKMHIPLPDLRQRKGILKTILNKKLGNLHNINDQLVSFIGQVAQGWCGADLQTLTNEAIYKAIAQNKEKVEGNHMLQAYQQLHKK